MRSSNYTFLLLFVTVFLSNTSCVSTMKVYRDDTESTTSKVKGIPFYAQRGVLLQETQYLHTWLEISLVKLEKDPKITETILAKKAVPKNIDKLASLECDWKAIQDSVAAFCKNQPNNCSDERLERVIRCIENLPDPSYRPGSADLVNNSWKPSVIVDYSKKYYLNSKMPWFGSSSLTQKLASNGTLTEATSTSDSQLDELAVAAASVATGFKTANSTIRVAEIGKETELMKMLKGKEEFKALTADQANLLRQPTVRYVLKVEEKGFHYTFSAMICDEPCNRETLNLPAITFNLNSGNYTRKPWPLVKTEAKSDKPTINVSGSIQLPKEEKKKE